MVLIAITRLRVGAWCYLPAFFVQALRSALQARAAPGNTAVSVLREAHRTFWTPTAWVDEKAMRTYMSEGVHRSAMRSLAVWCDEASVAHWMQELEQPPSWETVHYRMQREGRPSRVNRPTEAHVAYRIPPPLVRPSGVVRFR